MRIVSRHARAREECGPACDSSSAREAGERPEKSVSNARGSTALPSTQVVTWFLAAGHQQEAAWLPPRQVLCSLARGSSPCSASSMTRSASHQDAQCAVWRSEGAERNPRPPKRAASCAVCSAPSGSGWSAWPRSPAMHAARRARRLSGQSNLSGGPRVAQRMCILRTPVSKCGTSNASNPSSKTPSATVTAGRSTMAHTAMSLPLVRSAKHCACARALILKIRVFGIWCARLLVRIGCSLKFAQRMHKQDSSQRRHLSVECWGRWDHAPALRTLETTSVESARAPPTAGAPPSTLLVPARGRPSRPGPTRTQRRTHAAREGAGAARARHRANRRTKVAASMLHLPPTTMPSTAKWQRPELTSSG